MRLQDKVVVITGGGSGFGRECAQLFASEGAKVVVVDIDTDRANGTAKLVREQGGEVLALTGDVRVEEQVAAAMAAAVEEFGGIDVLLANAGVFGANINGTPIDEFALEDWSDLFAVNTTGVFLSCKHAVRHMKRRGVGGSIVVTSSAASFVAYPEIAAYSASKGALNSLVRSLAVDLGPWGIRANAVCPTHGMSPNFLLPPDAPVVGKSHEEIEPNWNNEDSPIPLKLPRPPGLRDNAKVALFFASDDSQYVSGVCMPSTDGATLSRVSIFFPTGHVPLQEGAIASAQAAAAQ